MSQEVPSSKATVLVVEDDEQISHLLTFILHKEGLNAIVAADGREAENLINTMPMPDLVLLDVMLPFADGFFLVRYIRNKPQWQGVPIIMLTSQSQEKDIVTAFQDGANDYLVKPFQPAELISRVRRVLKLSEKPTN